MWVGGVGTLKLKIPLFFKGNMHQKYDISLKDAFYIIDLLAEFFVVENFESYAKRHILFPSLFLLILLTFKQ